MTYAITSRGRDLKGSIEIKSGVPIHIKVPGRDPKDQPFVGFATKELGEQFLKLKNLAKTDYAIVSVANELDIEYQNQPILIFENQQQMIDMEKNIEGYDYESRIYENAL